MIPTRSRHDSGHQGRNSPINSGQQTERQRLEGELLGGPGIDKMLTEMGSFLAGVSPIHLGAGLECSIGEQLRVGNTGTHRSVHHAAPVSCCSTPPGLSRTA